MNVTKEAVQILKDARSILEKPNAWGRGYYAKDNKGNDVEATDKRACRFCALGAIAKAQGKDYPFSDNVVVNAMNWLKLSMTDHPLCMISDQNDNLATKQKHVLMAYDFAILMAQDELKKRVKRK
jgi:hypothetical protein